MDRRQWEECPEIFHCSLVVKQMDTDELQVALGVVIGQKG